MRKYLVMGTVCVILVTVWMLNVTGPKNSNIKNSSQTDQVFIIGIVPARNVFEQKRRYQNITEYLNQKTKRRFQLRVMSSYAEIAEAFQKNQIDAGFFGSFSYAYTSAKVPIEPLVRPVLLDGSSTYKGYLFTRKNSFVRNVKDMRGLKIALVDKYTTAGFLFPLQYLKRNGVDNMEEYFSSIVFARSHDFAAYTVFIGEADVGACKNHVYNDLSRKEPKFAKNMRVIAESQAVPSNSFAVRSSLNSPFKELIKGILLTMHNDREGKKLLGQFGATHFIETRHEDYAGLFEMLRDSQIDLDIYE